MIFRASEYFQAASERLNQAHFLHNRRGNYSLAMYCSGLAVECMLRAFRWRHDQSFEGRHDLKELLRSSGMLAIHEQAMRTGKVSEEEISDYVLELQSAINTVAMLWHNNLRYCGEASLRAYLNRIDRLQGVKGDPIKSNSADLLEAAQTIVSRGVILWTSRKK